jgi:hypothetical protein
MKLSNPPCRKAKKCLPFCGMCNLSPKDDRFITEKSLFGICRKAGKCLCLNWSDTQNCYWLNGRDATRKSIAAGTYDCTPSEHPHHHLVHVSDIELNEDKQATYNQMSKSYKSMYKEMSGLWGGYRQWSKK